MKAVNLCMAKHFKVINMCEHEWKKTGSYIDSYWDGYADDAVEFEALVIEYTCEKCGIIKEE